MFQKAGSLSGGQQQKVLIARALAQEAEVILFDEPTSNLDVLRQFEVMDIIQDLVRKKLVSAIIAIHDLNLASRYSDKIIMMKRGKIVSAGEPSYVLTADNIASVYGVEAIIRKQSEAPYIIPVGPIKTTMRKGFGIHDRDSRTDKEVRIAKRIYRLFPASVQKG